MKRLPLTIALALAVAALSLLLPWALAFDPQMWLVWGRQIGHLSLDTTQGPSWKPLPVIFTIPLAPLGGHIAPPAWLLLARFGALMALAGAFELARRIAGKVAGAVAALSLAATVWWLPNAALGNSEGILAALLLWTAVATLSDREMAALLLLTCATLLRPEVWPLLALLCFVLWRQGSLHYRRTAIALCATITALLWTIPPWLGGSGPFGASAAARGPGSDELARLTDNPSLTLLNAFVTETGWPTVLCAIAAAVLVGPALTNRNHKRDAAYRRHDRMILLLVGFAVGWIALVIIMTLGGYGGNPRYLAAASAAAAVLAAIGAVALARMARLTPLAALMVPAAVLSLSATKLSDSTREIGVRAERRAALGTLIARAGGRSEILRCRPLVTAGHVRGLIAWQLKIKPPTAGPPTRGPVTLIAVTPNNGGKPTPLPPPDAATLAAAPGWTISHRCD